MIVVFMLIQFFIELLTRDLKKYISYAISC